MTLVLALANRDQIIELVDRRLSTGGLPVEEEAGKCGSVLCDDAHLLFGFTGIAKAAGFETRRWILNALYDAAAPEYEVWPTLQRLKERATDEFASNAVLKRVSAVDRRLSILFTGYLYTHDPPVIGQVLISNYLNATTDEASPTAWDHFELFYTNEKEPGAESTALVQRIGAHAAMTQADVDALRLMLRERRPAKAIIGKATETMLAMADRPGAAGTIGKQISWLKIRPDPEPAVESGYYSNVPTRVIYMPSTVVVQSGRQAAMDGGMGWLEGADAPPLAVPKVGRRAPCPCGSGKRYKNCHGG